MDFNEVLKHRRMVRRFSNDPVPKDALERIVLAAKRAPSAGFSQGQRLVVVTDPEMKLRVAEGAGEDEYVQFGYERWVSQCGAQFVPCVSEQLYHERYQQPDKLEHGKEMTWPVPYWWMDIGCTVMLIILAAINEGLASGFAGPFPHPKGTELVRTALRIPGDFTPVGIMPVGYPLSDPPSPWLKERAVKPQEFARWNGW